MRVVNAADEEDADCSEDFYLMMSEEAPMTGEKPGPHLYVTSPRRGDFAEAGETYTVEVIDISWCVFTGIQQGAVLTGWEARERGRGSLVCHDARVGLGFKVYMLPILNEEVYRFILHPLSS